MGIKEYVCRNWSEPKENIFAVFIPRRALAGKWFILIWNRVLLRLDDLPGKASSWAFPTDTPWHRTILHELGLNPYAVTCAYTSKRTECLVWHWNHVGGANPTQINLFIVQFDKHNELLNTKLKQLGMQTAWAAPLTRWATRAAIHINPRCKPAR